MKNSGPLLLVADKKGRIYEMPGLQAAGMKAGRFYRLQAAELLPLPYGSELFLLPQRTPVGYNAATGAFEALTGYSAVAAFVSPGYTLTYNSAYIEDGHPKLLPLFAYGAVAFYRGGYYAAAVRVDREKRQDLRLMDMSLARKNKGIYRKLFPKNRLIRHLEGCAFKYGCPAAKNFFLNRYEAPLPTSPYCNARCIGCISYQPSEGCCVTQPRIRFLPKPWEIAEAALFHINNVKDPIVSFGQGCEGEPLLAAETIEKAISIIRSKTKKGIININTNGSLPRTVSKLFDAGLDSIRVSLNSARDKYYARYYKPSNYSYKDVIGSIRNSGKSEGFVSLNYLVMPGFTDTPQEIGALRRLIDTCSVSMIQWRNLNYDPAGYLRRMGAPSRQYIPSGIKEMILAVKKDFPEIMSGYFNPSRGRIKRALG